MIKKYPNDSIKEFYQCTEEIAEVLDKYYGRSEGPVEDMTHINTFVEEYVNGWGIDARCCSSKREEQQEKIEDLEEPWSKAINSMFDIDEEGRKVNGAHVSVTLPDGSETVPGALEDVTHYVVKHLEIKSNGQGGLTAQGKMDRPAEPFQLKYDSPYFGNDEVYTSDVYTSINLEQVLECMNEAMKATQDYHHCFVENLRYRETNNGSVHILEIITGS